MKWPAGFRARRTKQRCRAPRDKAESGTSSGTRAGAESAVEAERFPMGRSANTFAFVLVFVLLALVIYFVYQAATGTSGVAPEDQAGSLPAPGTEGKADPDRFTTGTALAPGEAREDKDLALPPVPVVDLPSEPPQDPIVIAEEQPDPLPAQSIDGEPPSESALEPSAPSPIVSRTEEPLPGESAYTTQTGDTPWFLAVVLLGDGRRWPDIVADNPGLAVDGRSPDKETALPAGLRVKAPRDDASKEETPVAPGSRVEYEVQAGETLSGLMQRFYGEASIAIQREILAANPDLDPDLLRAHSKIALPAIPGKGPKGGA